MIKRGNVIFSIIAHIAWTLSALAYRLSDSALHDILFIVFLILAAVSVAAHAEASRCPFCRKHKLHPKLSNPNAGYCRHCGRLVEYSS